MTSAYQQQLAQQLRDAETELGHRRRQVAELADELTATRASVIRHRTAWWSASRRATNHRTARDRAEQAEARIAAVQTAIADVRATRGLLGAVIADQIEAALGDPKLAQFTGLGPLFDAIDRGETVVFTPAPCAGCGSPDVVYRNYDGTPLCCTCAGCCPPPEGQP